jgi:uncharacterized protein YcbK (DUF882 family)
MRNYGDRTDWTQGQDPVRIRSNNQLDLHGVSDPLEQQLIDDFAHGISDPGLSDGTSSKEVLEQTSSSLRVPEDFFAKVDYKTFPDSFLIINDVYFPNVPIAAMSIEAATDVFVGETLRSQAPVIDSEGRQDFILRLSLPFAPGQTQAETLKRLMAQLIKHPFVFIHNNDIKQKLDVDESEITIFILEAGTLRSTTETVGLIVLDLQLHYFNYKPFSRHFYYNAKLPGYTVEPEHVSAKEVDQIDIAKFGGYEPSDYALSKLAERTTNTIRDGINNLTKSKRENVPVNMPSASDAWLYFANHLEQQSNPITGEPSDYIGFTLREYMHFNPSEDRYADGDSSLADLMNTRYKEINPLYRTDTWSAAFGNKMNESVKTPHSDKTAQERRQDELLEFASNVDPTRSIKFSNLNGQILSVPLLDENGNVPIDSIYRLTKFADRRKKTKTEGVFLSSDLIRNIAAVANHFPGRTIEVISTQRDPAWVRKQRTEPKNYRPSKHVQGKAIDFRVRGVPNRSLYEFLKTLPNIGAGFYPNSVFCHLDTRASSYFWIDLSGKGEESNYALKTRNVRSLNKYLNDHYSLSGDDIAREIESDAEEISSDFGTEEERRKQIEEIARRRGRSAQAVQEELERNRAKADPENSLEEQKAAEKGAKGLEDRPNWIESIEKQYGVNYYYDDPKVKNVFYKDIEVNISSDPDQQRSGQALRNVVCSAISISFGHRIAPLPLVSQSFYTYQFLGAGNKSGQIVLTFAGKEGKESAKAIKKLIWKARDNARDFTSIIKSVGSIGIQHTSFGTGEQNTIMALAGINDIVVTDIKEPNSPDGADKYELIIEFIAQDFASETFEQKLTTTLGAKQRIIKSIMQYVKSYHIKNVLDTDRQISNAIGTDSNLVRVNMSSVGRPYRLIGDTPRWVGKLVAEAAEICQEIEDELPPISWKIHKETGKAWREVYREWGAGDIFIGNPTKIAYGERNWNRESRFGATIATNTRTYIEIQKIEQEIRDGKVSEADGQEAIRKLGTEYRQVGSIDITQDKLNRIEEYKREQEGIFDKNGGAATNRIHKQLFDRWLAKMELLVREFKTHLNDGEVMDKYFPGVADGIVESVVGDITSCYLDINLPNVPGTVVPLPPEFYVYDDSHEDPLISNMTDDSNMEKFLRRHVRTEYASIDRYIGNCHLGGSYLSKNLPRILENRASEHERSEGERNFSSYFNFFVNGARSWEPLYTRKDRQDSGIESVANWQNAVAKNLGGGQPKDQRLSYLNNLLKMPAYVRNARHWETGLTEQDNNNLVKAVYGKAEDALAFGPNPLYESVDAALAGRLNDPSKERLAQAIEIQEAVSKASQTGKVVDLPGKYTVTPDGAVTFGDTEAEVKAAEPSFLDEISQLKRDIFGEGIKTDLAAVGAASPQILAAGPVGIGSAAVYLGYKFVDRAISNVQGIILDQAATMYEHEFASLKQEEEEKQIAKASTKIALGKKRNDLSMRRAYPTFKIFFIEDDSGETELVDDGVVRAFDDFYSYSAIQEIKVTRSRHRAADLAVVRMTNIGGLLLRRRFGETDKDYTKYGINAEKQGIFADTEREHPFEKMILQDGIKVQIRLGYASNQDNLETVFLGQIVEVSLAEKGKIIEIVCQGYGAELESIEFGPLEDGPYHLSSQEALSGAMIHPSIVNFGRQDRFNMNNPAAMRHAWTGGRGTNMLAGLNPSNILQEWATRGLESVFNQYQFLNFQQDDNIYAPPPDSYASSWMRFWNNACIYRPLKQTSWEIFKEHELRHPGYISLAVPYGHSPRMTMFFGSKVQHYWSKPPSALEIELTRGAKNEIVKLRKQGLNLLQQGLIDELIKFVQKSPKLGAALFNDIMTIGTRYDTGFALGELFGRYVPFRNYHYFDSRHHILFNEIRTSVDGTFNEVELYYTENENTIIEEDADDLQEGLAEVARGYEGLLAVRLDENIPDSAIRSYRAEYPSCVTVDMARRYAQGLFARTLRDSYKGELCVIGDEKIKPYDVCVINDESINMTGPVEVEAVTHIFNRDHGFISIITPDLCLEVNDYYTATVFDVASSAMSFTWGDIASSTFSPLLALKGIGYLGVAAGVKFMTWTQDGAPVMATPLTLGGKPFLSNTLGPNRVSLFLSLFGKWNQYWDDLDDAWRKFDLSEAVYNTRVDMAAGFFELFGADPTGGLVEATPNG